MGNQPTDFSVTNNQGKQIKLSDYRGKYVLIYYWSLCPGTIRVQPKLLELYDKDHDKGFEILGFTPSDQEDYFREIILKYEGASKDFWPLLIRSWTTIYTEIEGNSFMGKDYYFSGVPILMFISPDGITLERGYSEVYEKLKTTLEQNLGEHK